jgi:hypothetical protein
VATEYTLVITVEASGEVTPARPDDDAPEAQEADQ